MGREKVLVIDDEEDIRTVLRLSLETVGGFEVFLAEGGEQGLQIAMAERPDVILLDGMMPGMDGPTTLEKLRGMPELSQTPVIFLTAKTQRSDLDRFASLGVAGVLTKPFDPMTLPEEVRKLLRQ